MTETNENTKTSAKEKTQVIDEAHFFHPLQSSDEKETVASVDETEKQLKELMQGINEETSQLSEFLTEENKLVSELCLSLKQILKKLEVAINIPPQNIQLQEKVKKVILNEKGELVLIPEQGEKNSAFLAEYPPEVVMSVLWVIMPELAKAIKMYKRKLGARVNFFIGLKKELQKITKAIVKEEENTKPNGEQLTEAQTQR